MKFNIVTSISTLKALGDAGSKAIGNEAKKIVFDKDPLMIDFLDKQAVVTSVLIPLFVPLFVQVYICTMVNPKFLNDTAWEAAKFQTAMCVIQVIAGFYFIFIDPIAHPFKFVQSWWLKFAPWIHFVLGLITFAVIPNIVVFHAFANWTVFKHSNF